MHEVTKFHFNSQEVRVLINESGEPRWVAKDVCDVLGYANSRDAITKLCRKAGVAKSDIRSGGQKREVVCIDEGNLYRLIIKSTKKESEPFESWVCDEVLPTIRKTGSYSLQSTPSIKLLEGEIKEGASLLSQVIDRGELPEPHKWQLVDRLFMELFGAGVEMLCGKPEMDTPFEKIEQYSFGYNEAKQEYENTCQVCRAGVSVVTKKPPMSFVNVDTRYPVPILQQNRNDSSLMLSGNVLYAFLQENVVDGKKLACSHDTLYRLFSSWFFEFFKHDAPAEELLISAMVQKYRTVELLGSLWYVGVAPAVEVTE